MRIAIIFAAGVGNRMESPIPKQLIKVCGKEIIAHVIDVFEKSNYVDKIYVAFIPGQIQKLEKIVSKNNYKKVAGIVEGGENGQDSIYKALKLAYSENPEDSIVYIHDGVRPFITEETIKRNYEMVIKKGNSITVTPATETITVLNDNNQVEEIYDRSKCYTAQAPQSFYLKDMIEVHQLERKKGIEYDAVIDSSTLIKKHFPKKSINVIIGDFENIKITRANDLLIAETYFNKNEKFMLKGDCDEYIK